MHFILTRILVPWDLVDNYDVFVAGAPTGNPKMQLFMPGHMTVFRRTPEVAREFLKLEEVSSYDKFMSMDWIIRPESDGCGKRSPLTMALYSR